MSVPMTLTERESLALSLVGSRVLDEAVSSGGVGTLWLNEIESLNSAIGKLMQAAVPQSETIAKGIALLKAATPEQQKVLVALLETYQLSPDLGLTVDYDAGREVTGKPWAAATYTMGNWCKVQDAEYGETRDAAILALAEKLKGE